VDTHPRLSTAFLCTPGLEKEVRLYGSRTSYYSQEKWLAGPGQTTEG